jgi:hypothetical protein
MAIQAHFSDEDRERQAALTRSWEAANRDFVDPEFRALVDAKLAELDSRPRRRSRETNFSLQSASTRRSH